MDFVRKILKENWKYYCKLYNPTKHQKKEIQKMLDCSQNSCNSRICSSCGKIYADQWAKKLKSNLHPARPMRAGLLVILHTFGKDMKFHPHLHILTNSNINLNYYKMQ